MTLKYGKGKGEDTMWKAVDVISRAIEESMPAEKKSELMREVYRAVSVGHYNEDFAHDDISRMYYIDKNGTRHDAPYWPESAVKELYDNYKDDIPDYNFWDFLVTLTMIASNNWCMYKGWFPNYSAEELNEKFAEAAVTWLADDNWPSRTKIWDYLNRRA